MKRSSLRYPASQAATQIVAGRCRASHRIVNHSTLVATAATVLGAFFPSESTRLQKMAREGAISRFYGGIHFRFDTEAGLDLGRRVGEWALAHDVVGHEPFVLE